MNKVQSLMGLCRSIFPFLLFLLFAFSLFYCDTVIYPDADLYARLGRTIFMFILCSFFHLVIFTSFAIFSDDE